MKRASEQNKQTNTLLLEDISKKAGSGVGLGEVEGQSSSRKRWTDS